MNELANKISSYHIFNYLVPGAVFSYVIDTYFDWGTQFIQSNLMIAFFVYYSIGAVINRIGSLLLHKGIDMVFKIKKAPYKDYLAAEKSDSKISVLSEINNMYRSFFSLFFILLILSVINYFLNCSSAKFYILMVFLGLSVLYGFACKKQSEFIVQRIEFALRSCNCK